MWKFRSFWFWLTTRDWKLKKNMYMKLSLIFLILHQFIVKRNLTTHKHTNLLHFSSKNESNCFFYLLDRNSACNMTILYTCNWETLFTFSRRKLDIFPPSGSPPRLNWISTYLPWNNSHKLLNKVVSLNLSLP